MATIALKLQLLFFVPLALLLSQNAAHFLRRHSVHFRRARAVAMFGRICSQRWRRTRWEWRA
jgi:hypothetical protein